MISRTHCYLLIMSLCGIPAVGAVASEPLALWHGGQRAEAIAEWERRAVTGDADAALLLAYVLKSGVGVTADPQRAHSWYLSAARDGLVEAQYQLALMYELGVGVDPDIDEATYWYQRASRQSCPTEDTIGYRLGIR